MHHDAAQDSILAALDRRVVVISAVHGHWWLLLYSLVVRGIGIHRPAPPLGGFNSCCIDLWTTKSNRTTVARWIDKSKDGPRQQVRFLCKIQGIPCSRPTEWAYSRDFSELLYFFNADKRLLKISTTTWHQLLFGHHQFPFIHTSFPPLEISAVVGLTNNAQRTHFIDLLYSTERRWRTKIHPQSIRKQKTYTTAISNCKYLSFTELWAYSVFLLPLYLLFHYSIDFSISLRRIIHESHKTVEKKHKTPPD